MLAVNRASTSAWRSDWVGVGLHFGEPPNFEIVRVSPNVVVETPANVDVRGDKLRAVNEVPVQVLMKLHLQPSKMIQVQIVF